MRRSRSRAITASAASATAYSGQRRNEGGPGAASVSTVAGPTANHAFAEVQEQPIGVDAAGEVLRQGRDDERGRHEERHGRGRREQQHRHEHELRRRRHPGTDAEDHPLRDRVDDHEDERTCAQATGPVRAREREATTAAIRAPAVTASATRSGRPSGRLARGCASRRSASTSRWDSMVCGAMATVICRWRRALCVVTTTTEPIKEDHDEDAELASGARDGRRTVRPSRCNGAGRGHRGEPGEPGTRALAPPAGAAAVTPATCVNVGAPTLRFFARSTGGLLPLLKVDLLYREGAFGLVPVPVGVVLPGSAWRPTLPMLTMSVAAAAVAGGEAPLALRFTAVSGTWQIDDVFVDPYARR
jgi:hypothetical protein